MGSRTVEASAIIDPIDGLVADTVSIDGGDSWEQYYNMTGRSPEEAVEAGAECVGVTVSTDQHESHNSIKNAQLELMQQRIAEGLHSDFQFDRDLTQFIWGEMTTKLGQKRSQGYGGWWDPQRCSIESLKRMLLGHLEKDPCDYLDIVNFAAMIYMREELQKLNNKGLAR